MATGVPGGWGAWPTESADRSAAMDERLFVSRRGRPYNRDALRQLIQPPGDIAGVPNAHPHPFRHTFAINYLRNGGDAYTLQMLLGHSTMEMAKTYLQPAHIDTAKAHRRASRRSDTLLPGVAAQVSPRQGGARGQSRIPPKAPAARLLSTFELCRLIMMRRILMRDLGGLSCSTTPPNS